MFLALFSGSLKEETLVDNSIRTVLKLPLSLAPVKLAVLPLIKKDGLPEIAKKIYNDLRYKVNAAYDEKDAIGKRYRRQDALGTPFCVTVDHQSLKDETVTIRFRDDMKQKRIKISSIEYTIDKSLSTINLLKNL